ncbi:MAG: hypothetical protein HY721_31060 [Planctomycetes bacterium]|nr:hypothetical protein [Planctomycetota bacterium]
MELMQEAPRDPDLTELREQCRRQMRRRLEDRIRYGFSRVYKPVLDDAPYRAFDSTAEYRAWCDANLPEYLGYRIVRPEAFREEYEKVHSPPLESRSASEVAAERAKRAGT